MNQKYYHDGCFTCQEEIFYVYLLTGGAIAQMGERLTGSQEVVGSIPSSSTNKIKDLANFG